jgi:hypothetical protein
MCWRSTLDTHVASQWKVSPSVHWQMFGWGPLHHCSAHGVSVQAAPLKTTPSSWLRGRGRLEQCYTSFARCGHARGPLFGNVSRNAQAVCGAPDLLYSTDLPLEDQAWIWQPDIRTDWRDSTKVRSAKGKPSGGGICDNTASKSSNRTDTVDTIWVVVYLNTPVIVVSTSSNRSHSES